MNHLAIVLFGSNLGNRQKEMNDALERLTHVLGPPEKISSVYESASWGKEDEPEYLNMVAGFRTSLAAAEVLDVLLATEMHAGRTRGTVRYESRTIDLDLLFYGAQIIHEPNLHIPHPRMENRRFTLVPLHEIYPDLIHPVHQVSISKLLDQCMDAGEVIQISHDQ